MLNGDTTPIAAPVDEKPKRKAKEKTKSVNQKQLCVAQLLLARFADADTPIIYHEPARNKAAGGKTSGCFWKWSGKVWEPVSDRLLKQHVHTHGLQAGEKITRSFVDSVLDLARNEAYRAGHEFDRDRSGINVQNGTLQWSGTAWEMNPHCREEYRTVMLPIVYDPSATAPRFERFLAEIFAPDDDREEKAQLIAEAIGYSLTTSTDLERFFILAGDGANGKSILLSLLESLVGEDNVSAVQPNQFDNRFQRAYLHRKLINVVTELTVGAELPDDAIKGVVSGDRMTVEHKMQAPFDFKPFCTLWIGTNHIPTTRDFSDAIFRRTMIIPFNRKFEPDERENRQHLIDTLTSEASGILNIALAAYAEAIKRKDFTLPPSVKDAVEEWRENADPMQSFIRDILVRDDERKGSKAIASSLFYERYKDYSEGMGVKNIPSNTIWTKRLCKIMGVKASHTATARTIEGIRCLTEDEIQQRLANEAAEADVPF